jgi:hypothetical protein
MRDIGVGDAVPLARNEIEVEADQQQHQRDEAAREEHVGQRDRAREEAVRPHQRQAEEQIVVQQLRVPGVLGRVAHPAGERPLRHRAFRREQLVDGEELDQVLQLVR